MPVTEYLIVLRLAEQYLIRAEARAEQDNYDGANEDVNAIRSRAGLDDIHPVNKEEITGYILTEKRKELFYEWGSRWLDLKRKKIAGEVLSPLKPSWNDDDTLMPIPATEIIRDKNLTQNKGYE